VIATNPLFPRAAINHRLAWAGLSPENYPFDLVAEVESFHFAKPHSAFQAECLGRLGWPDGPVVMVGDDLTNDIRPARRLGLPAYWIAPEGAALPENLDSPFACGAITGLLPWLDSLPEEAFRPNFSAPQAVFAVLQSTPALLDHLVRDQGFLLEQPVNPGEWSPTEIFCHLRDVEAEVNLPRLQKVLQETNPFIPGMDTDPWAEEREYFCQDGIQALQQFTAARGKLLALLENLVPEDWERPARHAILGPTELKEMAGIIASHDRLHIRQAFSATK
jgi:FMN phosphatase YigB (HAD superfamily)